jgi:hypothetical protein
VAIINENNIWAVGEIYMKDSLGNPDPKAYNAVHWDGVKWELKRIPSIICGNNTIVFRAIYSIHAFNENNIFFTDGGEIIHFDGISYKQDCSINSLLTGKINKLWGTSSSDFYAVGNNGNIAHYNGIKWTKIESGTDLNINDIWGDYNKKTGEWEILAVGGYILHGTESERVILEIKNYQSQQLNAKGTKWPLISAWFISNRKYYVIGAGIYEKKFLSETLWKDNGFDITHYMTYKIRGNKINDVMVAGALGELLHYNGITWSSYIAQTMLNAGKFRGVQIKDNITIAVGSNNPMAVITMGIKNK